MLFYLALIRGAPENGPRDFFCPESRREGSLNRRVRSLPKGGASRCGSERERRLENGANRGENALAEPHSFFFESLGLGALVGDEGDILDSAEVDRDVE